MGSESQETMSPQAEQLETAKPKRSPISQRSYLYVGVAFIVVVGGISLSFAYSALIENCANTPSSMAPFNVPTCSGLAVIAVTAGAIAAIAIVLGILLVRHAEVPRSKQPMLAAVIFVGLVVVVAVIPIATAPPSANIGTPPTLAFPIPAGTTFNATVSQWSAFALARVTADPYAPSAPIELQGAWNATGVVCIYVARAAGPDLGPGAFAACGKELSFVFSLTESTWVLAFYVPITSPQRPDATVTISTAVNIVY